MLHRPMSRRSFLKMSAMTLAIIPFNWERIAAYAATIEPKNDYPTVIIGAGLGVYVAVPIWQGSAYRLPWSSSTIFQAAMQHLLRELTENSPLKCRWRALPFTTMPRHRS